MQDGAPPFSWLLIKSNLIIKVISFLFLRFHMSLSLLLITDILKAVNTENFLKHTQQQLDNANSTG